MATRRTTMRSRTGTKLYAVRDASGRFKDIQSYKKAHAADIRRTSKAEAGAKEKLMAVEKQVERAAKKAVRTMRAKLDEARTNPKVIAMERKVERAAKKAAKTVRASLSEAMTAVQQAARKVARQMSSRKPAAKTAARKSAARRPAKRAAKAAKTA